MSPGVQQVALRVTIQDSWDEPVSDAVVISGIPMGERSLGYRGLQDFYTDLILGRPMPPTLVMSKLEFVWQVVLVTFFLQRDAVLHPKALTLVTAAEMADLGPAGYAHMDPDLARLFQHIEAYVLGFPLSADELGRRLRTSVRWLWEWVLEGSLPGLRHEAPEPRVINTGTTGFVWASTTSWRRPDLLGGWIELLRRGFLRGILMGGMVQDHVQVLVAQKSPYLGMNLVSAEARLNDIEKSATGEPGWTLQGDNLLWGSTKLPLERVMKVVLEL